MTAPDDSQPPSGTAPTEVKRHNARPARPGSVTDVVLYHAAGCHLCERARAMLAELREELAFDLREVDISGDPELEKRYRELIPVVEIDGAQAFVYYVQPDAFRRKLAAQTRPA
ncbi:MAG: glutaredoxin family protein [Actinobacteria bacterium]|nr:glutaredoxin family protein [Actinomycetota bacterium]